MLVEPDETIENNGGSFVSFMLVRLLEVNILSLHMC